MVQQLSLFSIIKQSEFALVRASLSSLTGQSHPQRYQHLTIICKPINVLEFEPNSTKQQFEQYKIQLKADLIPDDPQEGPLDIESKREWAFQVYDIPTFATQQNSTNSTTAKKVKININSQTFYESIIKLSPDDSIVTILKTLGYEFQTDYKVKGERFFYGNITIELFQVLVKDRQVEGEDVKISWKPINESTMIKCFINVAKITDLENSTRSIHELSKLKSELQGLVELGVPDKNHMDSRIGFGVRR